MVRTKENLDFKAEFVLTHLRIFKYSEKCMPQISLKGQISSLVSFKNNSGLLLAKIRRYRRELFLLKRSLIIPLNWDHSKTKTSFKFSSNPAVTRLKIWISCAFRIYLLLRKFYCDLRFNIMNLSLTDVTLCDDQGFGSVLILTGSGPNISRPDPDTSEWKIFHLHCIFFLLRDWTRSGSWEIWKPNPDAEKF